MMLYALTALLLCGAAGFHVELISTSPWSLINSTTPGVAKNASGGFETGLVVKVEGSYHLFAAVFPPGPDWGSDILVHWTSPDGLTQWEFVQELPAHFHEEGGLYFDPVSPMPWYNEAAAQWELFFMWQAQPMPDRWTANGTAFRMLSQTPGLAGINGPWVQDPVPVLAHSGGEAWEAGMQDSISFPFYATASAQWVVFYGSGPRMCCADWLVGLAAAPSPSGPFTRLPTGNPVTLLPPPANMNYTENPTAYALPNNTGFVAVFDPLYDEVHTGRNAAIGFGFSLDGITWLAAEGAAVPVVAPGETFWAQVLRTPLGMVDEGDGTWSVFYTARSGNWDGLGVSRVRFVV